MNLPLDFTKRTQNILNSEFDEFTTALNADAPVSIRLNSEKTDLLLSLEPVPWCDKGYYLTERANFTFDPLFHAGLYYVQEASSMFLEQAIKQHLIKPKCILDLCAAPGGKSTHIRSLIDQDCLLVSNEIIRNRSYILAENLTKWGNSNIVVTQNRSEDFGSLTHFFDAIVVDAPCSGEGMFRKDEGAINEWSLQNVLSCAERQKNILSNIWDALKPGGILIYSTCTYNLEENEYNVKYIAEELGAEALELKTDEDWGITPAIEGDYPGYRFFPHKTKGEGFFLSVLRKNDDQIRTLKQSKSKGKKELIKVPDEGKKWIKNDGNYLFEIEKNNIKAFSKRFENELNILKNNLTILHYGITLGEIKGKDLVPNQSLALSTDLNKDHFHIHEIDYHTAISYLKNEALILDDDAPKGYILLSYKETILGWVKNLANRANNLYPQEWRIRTSYLPEEIKSFWM